jgi:LL-diaminopimelate aminotransferase
VPKTCVAYTRNGEKQPLHALWYRRQSTKFNGVSYPVQRVAEAVYSDEGKLQTKESIDYYLKNAALIRQEISALGFECIGGENSPYIWIDGRSDSCKFFDLLL